MKKLITTTGGHPLRLNDIVLMQDANVEGTKAMLDGLCKGYTSTGVYLSGVVITPSGATVQCTAGFIYWSGEIYPIDAQILPTLGVGEVRYWQIQQEVLAPSPVTYKDTTVHDVHIREVAVPINSTSLPSTSFPYANVLRLEYITGGPQHSIMPYYGPTTNFTVGGDGVVGSTVAGYALCNGGTSTLITGGTFTRPNFNGKVLVGYSSSETEFDGLNGSSIPNETGGEKTHTLTKAEIPKHTHEYVRPDNVSDTDRGSSASNWSIDGSQTVTSEDGTVSGLGGTAHNNLQPYHTVLWIIKLY